MKTKHHIILSAPAAQNDGQTQNNTIRRGWFALALGGLLFTSIFALSAPLVEAGCQQWDVSGQWMITQGKKVIHVYLSQNGKTISGTAEQVWVPDNQVTVLKGQVTGTIAGVEFDVQINWPNGGAGVYRGTIATGGAGLYGTTYDKHNLQSTAAWSTDHHFNCAAAAPAPAPPAPPKLHKAKPAATPSPDTAAAADDWLNQELRKRKTTNKTYDANDPNRPKGFINGLQSTTPTPAPSAEADESSSNDTDGQQGKHKKNKKKHHHHHDDDQDQGND